MVLLDGKMVSQLHQEVLATEIKKYFLKKKNHRRPKLSVILVGDDPSSKIYVHSKTKVAQELGIESDLILLKKSTTQAQLTKIIEDLNNDSEVDGILLQLPLPKQLDETRFLQLIDPEKDVDGFHFSNQGKIMENIPTIYPCTPLGIVNLLEYYELDVDQKQVSIIGTSNVVGRPLGMMLLNLGATVSFLNIKTPNLKEYTKKADILVSAVGKPDLINKTMVKKNAVVIDVGINRLANSKKIVGDVNPDVAKKAGYLSPVPGGVGPMTVIALMENIWKLYLIHQNKK